MALLKFFNLQFQKSSIIFYTLEDYNKTNNNTPTRKFQILQVSKTALAVDVSKNVPIMHKTLALREESKI